MTTRLKENNSDSNIMPYLRAAIICCKCVTKAFLLHVIGLSLTIVK